MRRNTNAYREPLQGEALGEACADDIERVILEQGPETVAAVFLEPVQNSGGCLPPPARLLSAGSGDLRSSRRPAGVRRGDLRLRQTRTHVRMRSLRLSARHHHLREGHHLGLRAPWRDDLQRPPGRALPRQRRDVHAWDDVRRPSRGLRGCAGEHRHPRERGSTGARPAIRGRLPRRARCR